MPICPVCQAEYRQGFTRCNSCEVDLVDNLPEEMDLSEENVRRALAGKELAVVNRGTLDAVMETRDLLSARRVPSMVVDEEDPKHQPGTPKRVALVVDKDHLEAAIEVLGENFRKLINQEGLKVNVDLKYESCPACGALVPEDAEECPECGLVIGKV